MAHYRANPLDGVAWVTGASMGIGRELALKLAGRGYVVAATSRTPEELAGLSTPPDSPGRLVTFACDVTDERAMRETFERIEAELGPIALAVFNAGIYLPTRGDKLETGSVEQVFSVNFLGALYGLSPVSKAMRQRGRGQIMLMGSASSMLGWPAAAAYGASKAAMNNFAEALKYDLDKVNVRIQIVNPGFVDTAMTNRLPFAKPFLISAENAADRIATAIERGGFQTSFPKRLTIPMRLLAMAPHGLRFAVMNFLTGWRARPTSKVGKKR